MKNIFLRRSIRSYQDKIVEEYKVEKLLKAGMQAPSAGNQQPWEFIIVQNKETLEKLSKLSPYANFLSKSPLAIILLGNKDKMKFPDYWEQDLSAVTQNILLEAVELDLGGVWLGVAPLKDREIYISEIFNLPNNIRPFSIISLGYPQENQKNKFIDRYDKTKIYFEKYL